MSNLSPDNRAGNGEFSPENRLTKYLAEIEGGNSDLQVHGHSSELNTLIIDPTPDLQALRSARLELIYENARMDLLQMVRERQPPLVQKALAETLQGTTDPIAIQELVSIMLNRTLHYETRITAVNALTGTKNSKAQQALASIITESGKASDYHIDNNSSAYNPDYKRRIITAAVGALKGVDDPDAIRMLARTANPGFFKSKIDRLLGSSRTELQERRHNAASALVGSRHNIAQRTFSKLLSSNDPLLFSIAIQGIGECKTLHDQVSVLKKIKSGLSDLNTAISCGVALRGCRSMYLRKSICSLLAEADLFKNIAGLAALEGTGQVDEVAEILTAMTKTDHPIIYRLCIKALGESDLSQAEDSLIAELQKGDEDYLIYLLDALKKSEHPLVYRTLLRLLNGDDWGLAKLASSNLVGRTDPALHDHLLGMFELGRSEDQFVRARLAAESLKGTISEKTINSLCDRLLFGEEYEQRLAAVALSYTKSNKAVNYLLSVACGSRFSLGVRHMALEALSTFEGGKKVRSKIEKRIGAMLNSTNLDNELVPVVISTLSGSKHTLAVYALLKRIEANNKQFTIPLLTALTNCDICYVHNVLTERIDRLDRSSTQDLISKEIHLRALYDTKDVDALTLLLNHLKDFEGRVKAAAIRSLRGFFSGNYAK